MTIWTYTRTNDAAMPTDAWTSAAAAMLAAERDRGEPTIYSWVHDAGTDEWTAADYRVFSLTLHV